jgi:hypothetical protein
MRLEDQLAAIRAVRSAVLGSAHPGTAAPVSETKIDTALPAPAVAVTQRASKEEPGLPFATARNHEEDATASIALDKPSAVPLVSMDDPSDADRLGPPTFQPSFLQVDEPLGPGGLFLRAIGALLSLVLLLTLIAQSAYWWRSDLALRVPQLRPYLAQACMRLHCDIEPPAEIDQLSIESSELVAVPGAANTLGFTALIRNHSGNALSYPAIEVTLTDAHDQAILRRVFFPQSYLTDASKEHLLAGIPGNSEFSLRLTFNTSGVATTGYRAGIFYP